MFRALRKALSTSSSIPVELDTGRIVVVDSRAEDHLMQPTLAAVRAENEPVGATLLEQLHLVALVQDRDLIGARLIRQVTPAIQHGFCRAVKY